MIYELRIYLDELNLSYIWKMSYVENNPEFTTAARGIV